MRRMFAVLFLAVAGAIGLTACGGSSTSTSTSTSSSAPSTTVAVGPKTSYEEKMQLLGQQIDSVMGAVSTANSSTTTSGQPLPAKTQAANLLIAQKELAKASSQLAKIVPPAKVKTAQALLLKGVREVANELLPVIAELGKPGSDPNTVIQKILTFQGLKDMQAASAAIAKSGYDILGTASAAGSG